VREPGSVLIVRARERGRLREIENERVREIENEIE
jgi:hypothetical protein